MPRARAATASRKQIAPDLTATLKQSAKGPFAVVYRLRGPKGRSVPAADGMQALVDKVIGKAAKAAKIGPQKKNIFRHLGSFVVMGDADLHRELVKQPEVCGAVLNQSSPRPQKEESSTMGFNKRPIVSAT